MYDNRTVFIGDDSRQFTIRVISLYEHKWFLRDVSSYTYK